MRFLVLNTDYTAFLGWLYARHPGLEERSYDEQMRARNESLFGTADFYSKNLRKLGHEAHDIHANNEFMQRAWAREHGGGPSRRLSIRLRLKWHVFPWLRISRKHPSVYDILGAQIRHHRPDVLLNHDPVTIPPAFLREVKPYIGLLVGQHASPLQQGWDFGAYDLMLSSLPNLVDCFRKQGIRSELFRLGFEQTVLESLDAAKDTVPVSFVGSFSAAHSGRLRWFEHVAQRVAIETWGLGWDLLPESVSTRSRFHGPAWGLEMYRVLRNSRITLNRHIDMAESYANNMRLYEATGVGTTLLTDWKENLSHMFEPGKEVVAYRTPEECVELIEYYLEHDDERRAIASAGQERTLREHTYYQRMRELVDIVSKYL